MVSSTWTLGRLCFRIASSCSSAPLNSGAISRNLSSAVFIHHIKNRGIIFSALKMSSSVAAPVPITASEPEAALSGNELKLEPEQTTSLAQDHEAVNAKANHDDVEAEVNKSLEVDLSLKDGAGPAEENEKKAFVRIKKRKIVLMMSYCGQGYYGMQSQKHGASPTIEGEFFKAMLKNNYLSEDEIGKPQSFFFQRAARTDKNVSAARQIISLKAPENLEIAKLNEALPPCIRIMGMKRVTQGFDSKTQCSARTYAYMTPTFAFAPIETNLTEGYRITPNVLENVRRLLNTYVGTKNFFNFTSGKKFNDPSAMRHIMSFECSDPFIKDGLEYCILRVKGQSFMLHQIRKMIGLCTAILRGFAHEDIFKTAFGGERIDVPKVPGLGLMLEYVHYDRYDAKFGSDGVHQPVTWNEEKVEVEKFCDQYIYPVVTETENKEKSMWNWMATLIYHTYAVRPHDDRSSTALRTEIGKAAARVDFESGTERKLEDDDDEEGEDDDEDGSKPKRRRTQKN